MDKTEQVSAFLEKCDELKKCKFIMATTKIKDILKCIVNSPELYNLFSAVTKQYDYNQIKAKCLVTINDGVFIRNYIKMPSTVGHRLVFVFCLLVEFDKDTINFNEFLRKFFPEDGSYYASYHAFCDTVIKGLRDAVAQVFKDDLEKAAAKAEDAALPAGEGVSLSSTAEIDRLIELEMQFLTDNKLLASGEKEAGLAILDRLSEAVRERNAKLINALFCGYNYFVLYDKCVSDVFDELINKIAQYLELLWS